MNTNSKLHGTVHGRPATGSRARSFAVLLMASSAACLAGGHQAAAATGEAETATNEIQEVVVSARKRAETALSVPVTVQAIGSAELQRTNTTDTIGLVKRVPGLLLYSGTTGAGGQVTLRGVGNTSASPSIDQAVSFIVDGVGVGSANIVRFGQVDLEQVEVLKGPQALFFGKNSPGGIINIITRDPGKEFEGKATTSYEFNAREATGELSLSGPITDTFGVRGVFFVRDMYGYNKDRSPQVFPIALGPVSKRAPNLREYMTRLTAVYEPDDKLRIRGKFTYDQARGSTSPYSTSQRIYCPQGTPQGIGAANPDNCRADNITYNGAAYPYLARDFSTQYGPVGLKATQRLASLDVNYKFTPELTGTAVTGYYKTNDAFRGNANIAPSPLLFGGTVSLREELSQELRLTSDFADSPINFMVGGYIQDLRISNHTPIVTDAFVALPVTNPARPASLGIAGVASPTDIFKVDGSTYSFFGQATWNVTSTLELSGGARYTHEKKKLGFTRNGVALVPLVNEGTYEDVSPEVTLSYRPNADRNFFISYREGFISGGFNTGNPALPTTNDISFRPEFASGFEGGAKARFGDFRVDASIYRYTYRDLQVSTFDPNTVSLRLLNAGRARVQGIDGTLKWRPSAVPGLEISAAANYNRARYLTFFAGCYTGQTVALGCNVNPGPTGAFRQQDLSGKSLIFAPEFTGILGANYDIDAGDYVIELGGDVSYSSSYFAQLEQAPQGKQAEAALVNASVRLRPSSGPWDLSLVGTNLTNVYRSSFVSQVIFTGISARTGTTQTGGQSDLNGQVTRGRQIALRASLAF